MDTLRRDAIQPYSNTVSTPNIFSFSKDSNVFENAIAPAPWTVPSHASLFTGKYPSEHGVHKEPEGTLADEINNIRNGMTRLKKENIFFDLSSNGYTCYGISSNPYLSPYSGFDESFNIFNSIDFSGSSLKDEVQDIREKYGDLSVSNIRDMISRGGVSDLYRLFKYRQHLRNFQKKNNLPVVKGGQTIVKTLNNSSIKEPFALFINFMEMHEPYTNAEMNEGLFNPVASVPALHLYGIKPMATKRIQAIKRAYYNEAKVLDSFFGQILHFLKITNLYENSVIILTSDHGQALNERKFYGHGIFLYDEIIRIPLIMKLPGEKKVSISDGYQSLSDIRDFIVRCIDGGTPEDILTKDVVFSEESRRARILPQKYRGDFDNNTINASRKAVYKSGFKATVNGSAGTLEEFLKNGLPVKPDAYAGVLDDLLNELDIFKGNERFLIPNRR